MEDACSNTCFELLNDCKVCILHFTQKEKHVPQKEGLAWSNFFFLPMVLVLAMASSVAGELSDQTLRDALCRPISRASALWGSK